MFHRTCLRLTLTVLTAGGVLSAGLAYGQLFTAPANEHPNPYVTINDHFKMPPGRTWGSTSAVDIDPDGTSIWVGERCGGNNRNLSAQSPASRHTPRVRSGCTAYNQSISWFRTDPGEQGEL